MEISLDDALLLHEVSTRVLAQSVERLSKEREEKMAALTNIEMPSDLQKPAQFSVDRVFRDVSCRRGEPPTVTYAIGISYHPEDGKHFRCYRDYCGGNFALILKQQMANSCTAGPPAVQTCNTEFKGQCEYADVFARKLWERVSKSPAPLEAIQALDQKIARAHHALF